MDGEENKILSKYEEEENDDPDDSEEEDDIEGEAEDKESMEDDEDDEEAEEDEDTAEQIDQFTASGSSLTGLATLIVVMIIGIVAATHFLGDNGFLGALAVVAFIVLYIVLSNAKTINPRYRALIERWGKFKEYREPGFVWLVPYAERIRYVDITKQMVTARPQSIISKDHLNLVVDAQIYFKVRPTEKDVKASQYEVQNYKIQIIALAGTTLRDILGNMNFDEANSQRNKINKALFNQISSHVKNWGIDMSSVEIKEIKPPRSVQKQMNRVVATENRKIAAKNTAAAVVARSVGQKESVIEVAKGDKEARILKAEGEQQYIEKIANANAKRIEVVNQSIQKNFKGGALLYKRYNTMQKSLQNNSKVIIAKDGTELMNIVGDTGKIIPVKRGKKTEE